MKRLLAVVAFIVTLLPTAVHADDGCTFTWGFAQLHDAAPNIVGACAENAHGTNTHMEQHTSRGLLVWEQNTGPEFTDGGSTWAFPQRAGVTGIGWDGPNGTIVRPNLNRWPWEKAAVSSPATASVATTAEQVCAAGSCYTGGQTFQVLLNDIARTTSGLPIVQHTAGTTLELGSVGNGIGNANDIGTYFPSRDTAVVATWVVVAGEFEGAAVLAHELTHAWQKRLGLTDFGGTQGCYSNEQSAYLFEGSVWKELWMGNLPPEPNLLLQNLNYYARTPPSADTLRTTYAQECGG